MNGIYSYFVEKNLSSWLLLDFELDEIGEGSLIG